MELKLLTDQIENEYSDFLLENKYSLFNHTIKYRNLLKEVLTEAEHKYYCLFDKDNIVATLPTFSKDGIFGLVTNSLPFYGSHGGVISSSEKYSNELINLCRKELYTDKHLSSSIIESLWTNKYINYNSFNPNIFDKRIGQITFLPKDVKDEEEISEKLMNLFHQKTRNMIKKGLKSDLYITHGNSDQIIESLYKIHKDNMDSMGGKAKTKKFFYRVKEIFTYDIEYRIYNATKSGSIISSLLVFYYKDMVEYFTPATISEFRHLQPMSTLIFQAMKDSIIDKKSRKWNWGGTWLSQEGVYRFKKRFGASDVNYKYNIKYNKNRLGELDIDQFKLQKEYEYFYVVPYNLVKPKKIL